MELFDAGVKGRGLRASRELSAGEVLLAEPGYAAVVYSSLASQVCHSCFRRQANLHRCAQCRFAHYCDRTCQTAGWDEHKQECAAIRKLGAAPNENVRLAGRLLWRRNRDQGLASDSQLLAVDQLQDHLQDLPEDELKRLQADVQTFLRFWSCGTKQHPADFICHVFGLIKSNGLTLPDQRGLQTVGLGLFPNLSLVNHDCWPNCTATLNHGNQSAVNSTLHSPLRMELRALGRICQGEELTISYVDVLNLSADRQKQLKERFHFDCSCDHCSRHVGDDLMAAAAEAKPSADAVKEVSAFSKETLEKVEKARRDGDHSQVLKLCQECLEKQQDVLADTHLYKLKVLSVLAEVLTHHRKFSEAAGYARKMVEGYTKLYHPNSAQLGLALMRSGVTHWHAGQVEVSHKMICEAYRIMMVTHGPNHSITKDLESIRSQTEVELKALKENVLDMKSLPVTSSSAAEGNAKDFLRQQ
ncbi:histone-lysine N-methyltransferase Smyd1-like [Xiphophorus hellerii]|uniref:histone-lysine N-methyltransferase Smyd1-like n=1 Tax=Xiphophorus hellerii TaxID=8084 RepID=UPI0013B41F52|nr:histone-lysine N-methyltransferase Smyd1-like [Xiphophorus hellerii]